jgi:FkbM family methyltransferase
VVRLRRNLAAYESRWVLDEAAVGLEAGTAEFGIEDTGRYGGIGVSSEEQIEVRVRDVNEVLESVLEVEPTIDILKVDVEGLEADLVSAIRPDLLERIERIYFEANDPLHLYPDRYHHEYEHQTNRLHRGPQDGRVDVGRLRERPRLQADTPGTAAETLREQFPRVAITHEWLTLPGGSEKVVLNLLELFGEAEIYTSIYDPAPWPDALASRPIHTSFLDRIPRARSLYPRLLPMMNAAFESFDLGEFDLVVSSNHACAKNVLTPPSTLHVCYCHTPMRYAWEPEFLHEEALGPAARAVLPLLVGRLRRQDLVASARPDVFIANSTHVAARIAKYYRRDAHVVHPPVDVAPLLELPRTAEDYYLVLGRLVPYKHAEIAVAACEQLGRRVKVAGDGRAMNAVRAVAGEHTEMLGYVDDEVVGELLSGARALLFPGVEDFGMVPVEAQAAGVPVIAYGAGGVCDSVIDGETGLLYGDRTAAGLAAAIEAFESMSFVEEAVRDNARRFAPDRFKASFVQVVEEAAGTPEPAR